MATTTFDPQSIANIAYQGIGLGILAGISMKTLDIMQNTLTPTKTSKKKKQKQIPMFQTFDLNMPKW